MADDRLDFGVVMGGEGDGQAGCCEAATACPPDVSRGAKCQTLAHKVDWLTLVGPESLEEKLVEYVADLFGEAARSGGQMHFYQASRRWAAGAVVCSQQRGGSTCMVQFGGEVLGLLGPTTTLQVLHDLLAMGMHCTRLDLANDYRGEAVGLIDEVTQGCRDGELCGGVSWRVVEEVGRNGRAGRGLYVGRPGKEGSGRMSVFYDKGLESGEAPEGTWERWECRFYGTIANEAAIVLAQSSDWESVAFGLCCGAIEFREAIDVRRSRRPECEWWQRWTTGVEAIRVRAPRRLPSLERMTSWVRVQVFPRLKSMAGEVGVSIDRLCEILGVSDVRPSKRGPVEVQLAELIREGGLGCLRPVAALAGRSCPAIA